jgi:eukaryotic-like serine/threonine-protein kinase
MLGSYQLLVPIGAGGMGRVWVARETRVIPGTGKWRLVAVKTALAEDNASHEFFRTLFDEARIASLLTHPNVCTIHVVEKERGVDYLVMDYSDGASLREFLDAVPGKRLNHHLAARIMARVCSGLQAAHDLVGEDGEPLGVVHRDVSPQNVLIAANGQVRITDFGVAKARGQLHAPTQTGEVKGKIAYMAPEQVTTRDIDRRVDVFAVGCMLYEATAGERPFHGGDALSTLYQLLEQPIIPPSARAGGDNYSPELEAIVLKAMARDRDERYPSAAEFGRALERWLITEKAGVADTDVAATLKAALGDHIEGIRQKIDSAITAIESGVAESLPPPDEEPVTLIAPSATPQGGRTLGGAALADITEKRLRPERRNTLLLAAAVAVAASLALFGLGKLTTREPTAKPAEPTLEKAPTTAPAATAPQPPASATLSVPPQPTDASTTPVATSEPSTSTATTATTRNPGTRRQPTRQPVTTTVTTPIPPASAAHLPDVTPPKRKTRVLDNENPFGE